MGTPGAAPGDSERSRSRSVRRSCRPGPCRCRGWHGVLVAPCRRPGSRGAAIVSAAFRYARILKGFSFLISRRSPISASTRAMARLFKCGRAGESVDSGLDRQACGLDAEIEQPGATVGECTPNRRYCVGLADAEQAPAASGAADLAAPGAGRAAAAEHRVDRRRRHAGCKPLAVLPLVGDVPSDGRPVPAPRGLRASHPRCRGSGRTGPGRGVSPSMWRFVISQLLMPELRDALVYASTSRYSSSAGSTGKATRLMPSTLSSTADDAAV